MLNPNRRSAEVANLQVELEKRVIGQRRAVKAIVDTYELFLAGLTDPRQPVGNFLFLGPTGTGKTRTVEAVAEVLFGDSKYVMKINGGEYQHGHEIAKLVGSPPGYLGHKDTSPFFTQERINASHKETCKLSILLVDEVEKASDALGKLLLGILDKGELTLGDNTRVDFSSTLIFMTSNLGAAKLQEFLTDGLGFHNHTADEGKVARAGLEAARRAFSPEFFNRLDRENIVTFESLTADDMHEILVLELKKLTARIKPLGVSPGGILTPLQLEYTPEAKAFLSARGFDKRYGARPLAQAVKSHIARPLAALLNSGQLADIAEVIIDAGEDGLTFTSFDGGQAV